MTAEQIANELEELLAGGQFVQLTNTQIEHISVCFRDRIAAKLRDENSVLNCVPDSGRNVQCVELPNSSELPSSVA